MAPLVFPLQIPLAFTRKAPVSTSDARIPLPFTRKSSFRNPNGLSFHMVSKTVPENTNAKLQFPFSVSSPLVRNQIKETLFAKVITISVFKADSNGCQKLFVVSSF